MTKSESFSWQRTSRVCNGLYDFGLLRDTTSIVEQKPRISAFYFTKAILITGVIAAFTLTTCLILVDRYQKSMTTPYHYESFVYEKDRDKFNFDEQRFNSTKNTADTITNTLNLKKIQNISKNIPIDEINEMMPITTILHPVSANERNGRVFYNKKAELPNLNELNKNINGIQIKKVLVSKTASNLAELLKRTEMKPLAVYTEEEPTTTETSIQFAQLESYRHYYNTKNLQDLMKFVGCKSPENCGHKGQSNSKDQEEPPLEQNYFEDDVALDERERIQITTEDYLTNHNANNTSETFQSSNLLYFDTDSPVYYPSYLKNHQRNPFDQFYNYRPSSPLEINDLDQESESNEQVLHRFSNRIYHNREIQETPSLYTQGLDPYLKPPTPPPTSLSFTPSYATSILGGFNDIHQQNELKSEATAVEPLTQVKPISLMVEIFPANNYELPSSLFDGNQYPNSKRNELALNGLNQAHNPSLLPWTLSAYSSNKMRLFVNLFPQHSRTTN